MRCHVFFPLATFPNFQFAAKPVCTKQLAKSFGWEPLNAYAWHDTEVSLASVLVSRIGLFKLQTLGLILPTWSILLANRLDQYRNKILNVLRFIV